MKINCIFAPSKKPIIVLKLVKEIKVKKPRHIGEDMSPKTN
jgi:hypothetical protein